MNRKDQLGYDILKKYDSEIREIKRRLNSIKEGNLYGEKFHGSYNDGSLSTNAMEIEKLMEDLLNKIQYGIDSKEEKMGKVVSKAFKKQ